MKTAVLTGSSRGIGRGIAIALARAGYDIGVHCATTVSEAEGAADEIKRLFQDYLHDFGRIDVMVNNAGVTRMAPFLELLLAVLPENDFV